MIFDICIIFMDSENKKETGANISELAARAEAFLFTEGEPLPTRKLRQMLECADAELAPALQELARLLEGSGISLVRAQNEVGLAVSPSCAPAIRKEQEKELEREIGDAGLEVLAILLYRGPSTRSQIDYIRGVNTSSTLRTLLSHGLAERAGNPRDAREYIYSPTAELLAHLGVADAKDLPDYAAVVAELAAFEKSERPSELQQ